MEKTLYKILQDLKMDINTIDLKYLKDKLEVLNYDCMHEENNFNYYNKKFFLNNLKFLLLKTLTFGICGKYQIEKYNVIRENLEENLDKIEEKYNSLLIESVVTETLLEINTNKEKSFKNNFNQIDSFLNFIEKMPLEEKEKIFSYKMS